jgi:hypothetical protein
MIKSLTDAQFEAQMGPIALVQRPPDWPDTDDDRSTLMTNPEEMSANMLSPFEFEDLSVAMIPPLGAREALIVGRLADCELVIDSPSVSKRHATVTWDRNANQCAVRDLGSTNGTFLNERLLDDRETFLGDGDVVSFGKVPFWYLLTSTLYQRLKTIHGQRKVSELAIS